MKKLILAASILFCTATVMTSCNNGDYDADPATNNSGTTNPINTGGNGGGGNGGGSNDFNWTGTDPMSAKVDGNAFQATDGDYISFGGFTTISGEDNNHHAITIMLTTDPPAGTTINLGGGTSASYSDNTTGGDPNSVYASSLGGGGSVKITENDATHAKGYFYFTGKNMAGTTKTVTEGYFNITK